MQYSPSQQSSLQLSLDPALQLWVLLPITLATLLMAILRRNLSSVLSIEPRTNILKITDENNLSRSAKLRRYASFISPSQFEIRRLFFVRHGGPFDKPQQTLEDDISKNSLAALLSPDTLSNQAAGLVLTVVPQMLLGSWASSTFQGLIICRLPFTLTPRFRSMLQSGVEHAVQNLDVSYVSSLSWFILNLFGNSALLSLLSTTNTADSIMPSIVNHMSTSFRSDTVYNVEREALLSTQHQDITENLKQIYLDTDPSEFAF